MFTLPTEVGQRIEQALAQRVCTANDGSYIRRSSGRRCAGRPTKYTVHLASGKPFIITAYDDGAAVEIANKRVLTSRALDGAKCFVCGKPCGGGALCEKCELPETPRQ